MKALAVVSILTLSVSFLQAQSIVGRWQLVKHMTCMDDQLEIEDETTAQLLDDMSSMSSRTPQVIEFKENHTGEESLRIIDKRKATGKSPFLYKFDGETIYFLDKKSKTIKSAYSVDQLEADSLVLVNSPRSCDVKVFVRLK